MKRLYQTLLLSLSLPLCVAAQSGGTTTTSFSLDECIQYALENTVDVKNARIDEQIAEARVKETVGIGLPQIDGSVNLTHNEKLPRFFASYAVAQGFAENDRSFISDDIQSGSQYIIPYPLPSFISCVITFIISS